MDRRGQSGVLAVAGLACAASLAVLAASAANGWPSWLTAALAFAGGASVPGTPTAVRALCTTLVDGQQLRVTAYAMLAMASTSAAILGPLAAGMTSRTQQLDHEVCADVPEPRIAAPVIAGPR